MKKLLLFLILIVTFNCYSQISFEKGYYIDNLGQKIECLIKNADWASSPSNFKYKLSDNDNVKTMDIDSAKEFGIYNISKYIRAVVGVDSSSENIDDLSTDKNVTLNDQQLFLKVLIEGKANLYEGGPSNKYFFNIDNSKIELLIFKRYKNADNKIDANNQFRKQLWDNLKCSTIKTDEFLKLNYKKNSLVNLFSEYNKCSNSNFTDYTVKQHRNVFNLTLRPRLNNSSLSVETNHLNYKDADFGKKTSFGFGIETEFILSFSRNKWSFLLEPTYQSFEAKTTTDFSYLVPEIMTAEAKYKAIEIPLGIRHYFFLNNNSKIFIDGSFIYAFALNSKIEYKNSANETFSSLAISSSHNFAFGFGYKLFNKYSVAIRYNSSRYILTEYLGWDSDYKTTSIILGYTLF